MWDYLPKEILIEILLKLPVESLIRATNVCKQWRFLIRSPSFISVHLSNSENQALVRRFHDNGEHYTVIPKRGNLVFNSDSEVKFHFKSQIGHFRIVGSCDGLVCLTDVYKPLEFILQRIIIWNPAIRNHVVLPKIQLLNPYNEFIGFGVANNVYKVVRFVYFRKPNGDGFVVPPQAEVFCLGGTGRWRRLSGFDVSLRTWDCSSVFFKGFVHWIAYKTLGENWCRSLILTFDLGDEVFSEAIMLPEELQKTAPTSWFLP